MPPSKEDDPRYVLLVEHDPAHARAIGEFFSARGMDITHAEDVDDAKELMARATFDLVVLDASHDHRGGMHLLDELRSFPEVGVVVVSDLAAVPDRIQALEHGADDYLAKPYDPHELLARLRAVHRRCRRAVESRTWTQKDVSLGGWSIDLHSRRAVHATGEHVELTAGEFQLLRVLLEHAGEVMTRERLASLTHRDSGQVFHRSIDVLVGRLRRKLESTSDATLLIETVRGEGYRVATAVTWQ